MALLMLGVLLGFVLALPPGPVAVTVIASALRGGVRHGLWAAAGASVADGVIALGVLFASSALVVLVRSTLDHHPLIALVGEIVVVAMLVTYAIRLARSSVYQRSSELREEMGRSIPKTIASAVATAIANLVNPTFLPSLAASLTAVLSAVSPEGNISVLGKGAIAAGFSLGTFAWLGVVVAFIVRHREQFSLRQLVLVRRIGAAIVLAFACILLWHVAMQ